MIVPGSAVAQVRAMNRYMLDFESSLQRTRTYHAPGNGAACTIMSAVEASTAADRCEHGLLRQDEFIRDTLTPDDYVLISVGGNDIAMAPTIAMPQSRPTSSAACAACRPTRWTSCTA